MLKLFLFIEERNIYKQNKVISQNNIQLSVVHTEYYLSEAIKDELVSFLAFFAARFSFNESAGFFTASFLLFRSLDMVVLQMGEACIYNCITVLSLYSKAIKMY